MDNKKISQEVLVMITFICAFFLLASSGAFFHKMLVEARVVKGAEIEGSAHYHRVPVVEAAVKVYAPDGKLFHETITDDQGNFHFQAEYRCEMKICVTQGGHKGIAHISAEDLPDDLRKYPDSK